MEEKRISWPGWETVKLIGRGSFGAVYEIQKDVFGDVEKAALKVISIPQNTSDIDEMYNDGYDDESITSTFQSHLKSIVAEYTLMRKMNGSANIVNCDDIRYVQHDDGIGWDIYIKMELLTPLAKALPADIPEETVIKVAKDMCAALELCQKHSIIHRDIKPQNIFVSPNGDYKLGDFGIAKTVEKTMGGTKIGTYKYMAPEVYNNQPYGTGADIYSLGLVLYWMLNERRMPFLPLPPEKLTMTMEETARLRRLQGEQLPPPAHGNEGLKKIVLKACAYDPKDRYATAAEMLQDLSNGFASAKLLRKQEEERRRKEEEEARKKAEEERNRQEAERLAREKAEREAWERAEQERKEKERLERERQQKKKENETGKSKSGVIIGVICMALVLLIGAIVAAGSGSNTQHTHEWNPATCLSPKTCRTCGKTEGSVLDHQWMAATTSTPKTCAVCGATEGGVIAEENENTGDELAGVYEITLWAAPEIWEITQSQIANFNASNGKGIVINAEMVGINEYDCIPQILQSPADCADIFCFSDAGFNQLLAAGALQALDETSATLVRNSHDKASVSAVTADGEVYGYPLTSHNGYIMYYDKSVISETDADSLESLITACEAANRKFSFDLSNGWYSVSFFFATGCVSEWRVNTDNSFVSVTDTFNSNAGLIAAEGIKKLVTSSCYKKSSFASDFGESDPSAVVISGVWDYNTAQTLLGSNLGVADLPCFNVDGKSYHLSSFSGHKLMGIKPQSDPVRTAVLNQLAQYLTSENCQVERMVSDSWLPSNVKAQQSNAAQSNPAAAALLTQNQYAVPQKSIHGSWWDINSALMHSIEMGVNPQDALLNYEAAIAALFN